ncbi:MAG: hypothetical protein V1897_10865 [Pseudomonadota bacterium]
MDEYHFVNKKIEGLLPILNNKGNVYGVDKVLKNLNSAKTLEDKMDHVILLEVGIVLSSVGIVEFEKKLLKPNPHDILLTFKCTEVVIEVKRIRKTTRHDEIVKEMFNTDNFIEVEDKEEFRKLISKIVDEKYDQLEDGYPNIVLIVSKDIFFRATNVQDAASEIMRLPNHSFYPDYNGDLYIKLNALLHMNEITGEVKGFPVHRNEVINDLINELES